RMLPMAPITIAVAIAVAPLALAPGRHRPFRCRLAQSRDINRIRPLPHLRDVDRIRECTPNPEVINPVALPVPVRRWVPGVPAVVTMVLVPVVVVHAMTPVPSLTPRSEERRVGKEGRPAESPRQYRA